MEKLKSSRLRRFPHSEVFYSNDIILMNKINELIDFANEVKAGIKAASIRAAEKEAVEEYLKINSDEAETKVEPENGKDIAPEIGSS